MLFCQARQAPDRGCKTPYGAAVLQKETDASAETSVSDAESDMDKPILADTEMKDLHQHVLRVASGGSVCVDVSEFGQRPSLQVIHLPVLWN